MSTSAEITTAASAAASASTAASTAAGATSTAASSGSTAAGTAVTAFATYAGNTTLANFNSAKSAIIASATAQAAAVDAALAGLAAAIASYRAAETLHYLLVKVPYGDGSFGLDRQPQLRIQTGSGDRIWNVAARNVTLARELRLGVSPHDGLTVAASHPTV